MKFKAMQNTQDGRLTAGKVYTGSLVVVREGIVPFFKIGNGGLRIVVCDNRGQWTTFNPKIFRPIEGL